MRNNEYPVLYKYVPVNPYLRSNLLRILEKRSVFFSRKKYLNDPIDCEPRIDLDIADDELVDLVKKASRVGELDFPINLGLGEIAKALESSGNSLSLLDEKYIQGLFGLSKSTGSKGLLGGSVGTPLRKIAKSALEEFCRRQISEPYIFSLSRTEKDPLLWGHYAQGHTGICIGLSGIEGTGKSWQMGSVEYSNRRPTISVNDVLAISDDKKVSKEAFHSIFFKKSENWRNEAEVRLVTRPQTIGLDAVDLHLPEGAYVPVQGLKIECIIFGAKCSDIDRYAIKSIIEQKCDYENWPTLKQANFEAHSYNIKISPSSEKFILDTPIGPIARALMQNIGQQPRDKPK